MLHLLPFSLVGGLLTIGLQRRRRPKSSLISTLLAAKPNPRTCSFGMRLDGMTLNKICCFLFVY
jgi:hypothetical protein